MENQLFKLNWQKYLTLILLLFSVGFLSSGVITWIAANWDFFSKFEKLYGVQILLILSLCAAVFSLFKHRQSPKQVVVYGLFFLFSVIIGGLLALIGQTYQTGADAWELFAWWSIIQLPILLLFPNVANALLFFITTNLAVALYLQLGELSHVYIISAVNFVFILLSEFFSKSLKDQSWRVLPKVSTLLFICFIFIAGLDNFGNFNPISAIIFTLGLFYYKKFQRDLFCIILYFLALICNINYLLAIVIDQTYIASTLFISLIFTLSATIFGTLKIKQWYELKASPWAIQALHWIVAFISTCLIIAIVGTISVATSSEHSLLLISLCLLGIGLYKEFSPKLSEMLIAISMILGFIYFSLFLREQFYDIQLLTIGMLAYTLVVFFFQPVFWLQTLAATLTLISIFIEQYTFLFGYQQSETELLSWWFDSSLFILLTTLFYILGKTTNNQLKRHLSPLAWAALFTIYITTILMEFIFINRFEVAPELPKIHSFGDFFHIITFNIFAENPFTISKLTFVATGLLPLIFFVLINKTEKTSRKLTALISFILAVMSIAFISSSTSLLALALMFLAYFNRSRTLFGLSVLLILFSLNMYYYSLNLPLLYKSILLLAFGSLFAIVVFALYRQTRPVLSIQQEQPTNSIPHLLRLKSTAVICLLIVILTGANKLINKYEDILANGQSIILKLAPVDPRSLMQGDYMELNYEILDEVWKTAYQTDFYDVRSKEFEIDPVTIYALLKQDKQGVAQLCGLEIDIPTDFKDCDEQIYLPIKISDRFNTRLPTHSYFFEEGKGAYYAQAAYGEYKFKEGKALLLRLLDEKLNPL